MASENRKRLKAAIADHVKRQQPDLTKAQQEIRAKQLLHILDGDAGGIFDTDPAKNIPAIIEFTYEFQLDRSTSDDLSKQAEQLRALARKARTLADGIELGMALQRFLYESGPEAEAVRKKQGSNAGAKDALAKKNAYYHDRADRIMNKAKVMFTKNPDAATKQVAADLLIWFNGNPKTIEKEITAEQMYRLVLNAKRELKMRSRS
jgi:hypothetical protein